jgi:hypothetical protein
VRRIIEDMVTDGQFDECNLRMRDLTRIRETIIQTLGTLYHERVPYPGFREEELVPAESNYEAVPSLDMLRAASPQDRESSSSAAAGAQKVASENCSPDREPVEGTSPSSPPSAMRSA